jgi:putative ABC transport system permease protein
MDGLFQDLRYAARSLRRAPGVTVTAVGALALAIGASSAIFSGVRTVLLEPLPIQDPERVVTAISVSTARGFRDGGVSYADHADWSAQQDLFQAAALWRPQNLDLTGGDQPERVRALAVTGDYFLALGAPVAIGRVFGVADETAGERPIVLSNGAWRRLFGADPDAIGRKVYLSGVSHIVAGVLAPGSAWPLDTDAFVPMHLDPARSPGLLRRDNLVFRSLLRLRPDVPIEQARTRLAALAARIESEAPNREGLTYDLVGLHEYTVGDDFRQMLLVLVYAVGFVLLIACANVANLLLARGTDRRRELAMRSALGATRRRLVRGLLAEAVLLAAGAGGAGLAIGYWLSRALVVIAPDDLTLLRPMGLEWEVLAFAAAASLATAIAFGTLPALHASAVTPGESLKEGPRTGAGRSGRLRDVIVGAQLAVAVTLLACAGLLVRSLIAISRIDPGVAVENVLGARLIVPGARYPDAERRTAFYQTLLDRIEALPGVQSAAVTSRLPAGGAGFGLGRVFLREGQPEPPASSDYPAQWTVVSPDYFRTLGIHLRRGRAFTSQDDGRSTPVIVISERLAEQMFPEENPIGRRIRSWRDENLYREVVGVVGDVRYLGLTDRPRAAVYVPHAQDAWGTMMLAVKTAGPPLAIVDDVRREVSSLDPMLALGDVRTLADASAGSVDGSRFTAYILGAFAALALALAIVGVYAVMAFAVSRRMHEMGVRLAVGARPRDIAGIVMRRGLLVAAVGALFGLMGALGAGRALESLLVEISPVDPLTFIAAPVLLVSAALAACVVPALRASRIDPIEVLRES